ncbi:MAG TPA: glycine betaine ABC transporter substrate-binding protein, partial [Bacillota bacterium]
MANVRKMRAVTGAIALVVLTALVLTACGGGQENDKRIRFGTQTYAEVKILAYAGKMLLEKYTDCTADVTVDLGGIAVLDQAMTHGDIDAMIAFTGGAGGLLHPAWRDEIDLSDPKWRDPDVVYEFARDMNRERLGRVLLEPLGYNNTYALTMRRDRAEELGIRTVSDLQAHSAALVIGMDDAYKERPVDGYQQLLDWYGLDPFKETVSMNINLLYQAIRDGQVDIGVAYSSDARIYAYDLVWLEDDKQFFPPYHALYALSEDAVERCPEAVEALSQLSGQVPI